jgi:hypothetical protein
LRIRKPNNISGLLTYHINIVKIQATGLIKVDLEFSSSIPGLFQTWNSNKPSFEILNSRSEPGFEKLNSRSELRLSKKNN